MNDNEYELLSHEGMVNLAEPKRDDKLFAYGFDKCPTAEDFDISGFRGSQPWEFDEDIEQTKILAGRKTCDIPPFVCYSGMGDMLERRKKYPMQATEEEIDELTVLSGVREREPEEQYIEEVENKLNLLVSELKSTVNILKTLIKDRIKS